MQVIPLYLSYVIYERFKITKIEKNMITIQNDNKLITFDAVEDDAF